MLQLAGARVHYIERVVRCLCLGIRLGISCGFFGSGFLCCGLLCCIF
jgi:hypothetical protein